MVEFACCDLYRLIRYRRRGRACWGEFGDGVPLSAFSRLIWFMLFIYAGYAVISEVLKLTFGAPIYHLLYGAVCIGIGLLHDYFAFKLYPLLRLKRKTKSGDKRGG